MSSSLQELLVSDKELAESLGKALLPLLTFTQEGDLVPKSGFLELSSPQKIIAALLALKAQHLLKIRAEETVGPTELSKVSGLPLGTIKRTVRELEQQKMLTSSNGQYWIPLYALNLVAEKLSGGTKA